jgi:CheY-like chemotaxis protein
MNQSADPLAAPLWCDDFVRALKLPRSGKLERRRLKRTGARKASMKRPLRILVAEDDENDVLLLRRAFDRAGVEGPIHFVRDGEQAINYLKRKDPSRFPQTSPTLLLLDLKMSALTSLDVLRWLRTQPGLNRLLVVVFSASEAGEEVRRAYDLGADSCLTKPQDLEEFLEVVRDMETLWLRLNATPECGFVCEATAEGDA